MIESFTCYFDYFKSSENYNTPFQRAPPVPAAGGCEAAEPGGVGRGRGAGAAGEHRGGGARPVRVPGAGLVLCSAPSVPQSVVQSRRRPLLGPSPG